MHNLTASVQSPTDSSTGCWQDEVRTRTMPCPAPILIAAFAAERVKCQNLLTPSLHPAAAPSHESAPDAYSLGSLSFSNDKSLQLQWPQELLRAAPAGNLPLSVSGGCETHSSSSLASLTQGSHFSCFLSLFPLLQMHKRNLVDVRAGALYLRCACRVCFIPSLNKSLNECK